MSLNSKGISCAHCKSYLFTDDDVVYCPVCGAPHHRECYNALGHCALEEYHGTEKEYSAEKVKNELPNIQQQPEKEVVKCEMCGERYNANDQRCPKCGNPNLKGIKGFGEFDFLGGVPADYDIGDGITADEVKQFVATNTHRYVPKFAVLSKKNKCSWNWMAFLFPAGWMLSRKMFKSGIITAILTITASCLSYPLMLKMNNLGLVQNGYLTADVEEIAGRLPEIGLAVIALALLGAAFDIAIRLISALLGDYMYKSYSIGTIKRIKSESTDRITDFRKKGGMSMLLFLLGIMIVQYGYLLVQFLI